MQLLKNVFLLMLFVLTLVFVQAQAPTEAAMSAHEICPILLGEEVPNASLRNLNGDSLALYKLLDKQPTVMVFYRGGWCMYCNKQLSELRKVISPLREMGYQILGISPDNPEHIQKSIEKHEMTYTLLSDSKMELAKEMGIAFKMEEKTLKKYKLFGIDLEKSSSESHFELPAPAVFIVNKKKEIVFSYANPNYKVRLEPEILLKAAEVMK